MKKNYAIQDCVQVKINEKDWYTKKDDELLYKKFLDFIIEEKVYGIGGGHSGRGRYLAYFPMHDKERIERFFKNS
jgi:hypothetical protein